jgi:hypothetical protein
LIMVASSADVVGSGRAERRRRWCSCEGVIFSAGSEKEKEGRRLRTDQVGFSRIEAAVGDLVVMDRVVVFLFEFIMMARRSTSRQEAQIAILFTGSRYILFQLGIDYY